MARYIDAEKAVARFEACLWGKDYDGVLAKSCIDDTPTADVVEVVRCKECIYWNRNYCHNTMRYYGTKIFIQEDDFCSRGERWKHAED